MQVHKKEKYWLQGKKRYDLCKENFWKLPWQNFETVLPLSSFTVLDISNFILDLREWVRILLFSATVYVSLWLRLYSMRFAFHSFSPSPFFHPSFPLFIHAAPFNFRALFKLILSIPRISLCEYYCYLFSLFLLSFVIERVSERLLYFRNIININFIHAHFTEFNVVF